MADDWQDIGTGIEIFPNHPNWADAPQTGVVIGRDLRSYSGTITTVDVLTTKTPFNAEARFMMETHDEIDKIVDFFVSRVGRVQRFWYRNHRESFTLKEPSNAGGGGLVCYPNSAELFYEGFERIYLRYKSSGDYMSRKVNSVIYDNIDDDIELILNTILDRQTVPADVEEFGRLILCRFDIDTLTLQFEADGMCVANLRFYELVEEYAEI